jgi:predicted DNA-binding transcriptional regulator YafY
MLTEQELATVLAALRHWQQSLRREHGRVAAWPHFEDQEPLTLREIDELCERLNSSDLLLLDTPT